TDGVYRVYLYNLAGQATAKLEAPEGSGIDLSQQAPQNSPANASALGGLMRTETRYDAMGNVLEQRLPLYTAPRTLMPVDNTTVTVVTGTNGPAYLQWFAPPDSTLHATLYFDNSTTATPDTMGVGSEYGYTVQASLVGPTGQPLTGQHSYRILYQRPGDS